MSPTPKPLTPLGTVAEDADKIGQLPQVRTVTASPTSPTSTSLQTVANINITSSDAANSVLKRQASHEGSPKHLSHPLQPDVNPYLQKSRGDGSYHGAEASIHGVGAAKRRAVTDLLFFASVGDISRCQKIVDLMGLNVADESCRDYDHRTPLHLSASVGAVKVTAWLLEKGAQANALDRFSRTSLEEACRGRFSEVIKLLMRNGGKVMELGKLVPLQDSRIAGMLNMQELGMGGLEGFELDAEWEIDPKSIELLDRLGEGSFGTVYRARYRGTIVAVKVLSKETDVALGDFRTEIGTLRKISHPNAVQFLGAVTKNKPYMLVMEHMAGGSLADHLKRRMQLPIMRLLEIALDFARGMAYLHSEAKAIIHRDLKPNNLLISGVSSQSAEELVKRSGVIKISDFGLSKSLPIFDRQLSDTYQLTGGTGSFRYMSPEVFRHNPYNAKVDVYSFAMILYQMIELRSPFEGTDPVQAAFLAEAGRRPEWQIAYSLPMATELMSVVEACWEADPDMRPTFEGIIQRLEKIQRDLGGGSRVRGSGGGKDERASGGTPGRKSQQGQGGGGFFSFLRK